MKNKIFGELCNQIQDTPRVWLITGVAGFIGSNLLEALLDLNQKVVGLDNFSTGHQYNLDEVKGIVGFKKWQNFNFRCFSLMLPPGHQNPANLTGWLIGNHSKR